MTCAVTRILSLLRTEWPHALIRSQVRPGGAVVLTVLPWPGCRPAEDWLATLTRPSLEQAVVALGEAAEALVMRARREKARARMMLARGARAEGDAAE